MTNTRKLAAALAALTTVATCMLAAPNSAAAHTARPADDAACRGSILSSGLTVAREAGRHGLPDTLSGSGIDSVQELQELISDYCSAPTAQP